MKDGHIEEFCRANPWCWLCKEKHYPGHCERVASLKSKEYDHDDATCAELDENGGGSSHSSESSDTEEQQDEAEEQPGTTETQPGWEPEYEE